MAMTPSHHQILVANSRECVQASMGHLLPERVSWDITSL